MSLRTTPRRAVVLAAGFGTRMLPLTHATPKPLLPVWGTPVLERTLDLLQSWGVRDVLVNLHHGADRLFDHLVHSSRNGLRIHLSFEPAILGTGGALRRAAWFPDDDPFWIVNADILADLDPAPLLSVYRRRRPLAVLWMHPTRGPRTVEMRGERIASFRSQRPGAPGTCTFCGLQLVRRELLRYLPDSDFCTLVEAYERAQADGATVLGATVPNAYWADIGAPADYLAAHREILAAAHASQRGRALFGRARRAAPGALARRGVRARGFVALGTGVVLARGARVEDSVLWDGASLGPHADVRGAIVGGGTRVDTTVDFMALRADELPAADLRECVARLGWPLERTLALPLPPRGSARTFQRLSCGRRSAILIRYSLERAENGLYAGHARFLRAAGVRVPEVLLDRPEQRYALVEDAGRISIQDVVPRLPPEQVVRLYERVLDQVVRLHGAATAAARRRGLTLPAPFARKLYLWEQNLFCEEFLQRHARLPPPRLARIRRELRGLIPALLDLPQVLVHRDLQSSNILLPARGGRPVFIDFQGMRFGPAAYDLASLLCDPYVRIPGGAVDHLLAYYRARLPAAAGDPAHFWMAAVERLAQALGAYGRLGAQPPTAHFLRHVPAGLRAMRGALEHIDGLPGLKEWLHSAAANA
jgi:mannose-1-phosphate guanylyltransferase